MRPSLHAADESTARLRRRRSGPRWLGVVWVAMALQIFARADGEGAAAAAPHANFFVRNWRVDEGLPHNGVNRVVQDASGFLWIATGGGLVRFDGINFRDHALPAAPLDASYNIRDLAVEDERTLVMLPASGGIARWREGSFSEHPASAALAGRQLLFLFAERGGVLWVVSANEASRWENGRMETFGPRDGLVRRGQRMSFATDRRGRTWVAGGDFLGYYEGGKLQRREENLGPFITVAPARSGGLWVATVDRLLKLEGDALRTMLEGPEWSSERAGLQEIFEDSTGALWIATRRYGLSRFADGRIERIATSHTQVMAVTEDTEGNIWVATNGGGVDRLRRRAFVQLNGSSGLPDNMSTAVCDDGTGTLWCANRSGGLVRWREGQLKFFRPRGVTTGPYMNVVCPDRAGNVWAGSTDGVFRVAAGAEEEMEAVSRQLRDVHLLFSASNGDMWVASADSRLGYFRDGKYHALQAADGYNGRRVRGIAEDASGRIFVASDERQLLEFVAGRLEVRVAREEMPGGVIYGLHFDADGALWMATSHGVVVRRGGRMQLLSVEHGLPDDLVAHLLEDEGGRFWFASRRGIFSVARAELVAVADGRQARVNAITLGPEEGLRGASALSGMQPMAWKARDGRLWFCTHEGVVGIDPRAALPPAVAPRIFIDEVLVDRKPRAGGTGLKLQPGDRQVEFRFAALNFAAPEKVRVRHQLLSHDFDWVETGSERRASYARLPPGNYALRVSASNQDGRWSEGSATLAIAVAPAWWQMWWVRGVMLAWFTGAVVSLVRYWSHRRLRARLRRLEYEHALEKERARIARDLHDDLGGSLTQIGLLADRLKRQTADTGLKPGLGQLVWRTRRLAGDLESIVWTVSAKNNLWDRLASFVAQYAHGFFRDTGIQCSVSGEETIPSQPLAPDAQHHVLAVLKEALNNVLKHAQATNVNVTMTAEAGEFRLRIADNGVGFDPTAPEHAERNGLSNMRSRAAELGGALEIESAPKAGAEIRLRVPLVAAGVGVR